MTHSQKLAITASILLLLGSFVFWQAAYVSAQSDQAALNLQEANNAFNSAFNAISDAEKAGANVIDLLLKLNIIADSLASSESTYVLGDLTTSIVKSNEVIQAIPNLIGTAQNEKQFSSEASVTSFWITLIISIVGAVVFVTLLIFIWRYVKRWYIKEMSRLKPEVLNT